VEGEAQTFVMPLSLIHVSDVLSNIYFDIGALLGAIETLGKQIHKDKTAMSKKQGPSGEQIISSRREGGEENRRG